VSLYILQNKKPVPVDDALEWAKAFQVMDRQVAHDVVSGAHVSTVFLGVDHGFGWDGPPILFETMIFGGEHDGFQQRCSAWDEALVMHRKTLAMLTGGSLTRARRPISSLPARVAELIDET
jgi:hypothetical protein